ncbi:MAG TPA: dUTP diphosphatase [Candidatus Avacidaminococcus intestinavium]|uniref:dUTP diphosphatase n=1 Tax=Candidatus Avacidaminococcus intestinavium TaxID=2840684 RepID=A0A9D1MQR0_9FIRM|nr:dUTP diphosphatase [Candidatus Avacidaminococcus intestinavium]
MKKRGFEKITNYQKIEFSVPVRKTERSAGYDFYLPEDVIIKSNAVTLVPTGIKAYMQNDEYLGMHIRSGTAMKMNLTLINSQGIVDADYYNNEENEGHIMLLIYSFNKNDVHLKKGERIAQGIFYKFLLADDDDKNAKKVREGGFGSTR